MNRVNKYIFICSTIILTFIFAAGCSSGKSEIPDEPIILTVDTQLHDDNISDDVPLFLTDPVPCGDCYASIVGITFTPSSGDAVEDSMQVGNGLDAAFVDGTGKGFDIGFMNASNEEVAKRDAYLCLYLKYSFSEEVSQRDSVIPDMKLKVTDHEDEPLIMIHDSMEDTYVNVNYPYGIIILKGYADSQYLTIEMNDVLYQLNLA